MQERDRDRRAPQKAGEDRFAPRGLERTAQGSFLPFFRRAKERRFGPEQVLEAGERYRPRQREPVEEGERAAYDADVRPDAERPQRADDAGRDERGREQDDGPVQWTKLDVAVR